MQPAPRVRAPGRIERALAIVTIVLLAISLPSSWLTEDTVDVPTGDSLVIVVFLILFAFAATFLSGHWRHVVRAVRREPLLPAFLSVVLASAAWSGYADTTIRRSVALFLTTFFGYYLVVRFPLREIIRLAAIGLTFTTLVNYLWIVALPKYGITNITTEQAVDGDWSGVLTHKNALGRQALVAALVFVFAARTMPRWRIPLYGFAVLNAGLIIGAQSQTALVSLILVMVLMALYLGLRGRRTLYGGVFFGLLSTAAMGAVLVTTNLAPIANSLGRDGTLTGRTQLWTDVLHEIRVKPLLGYGWSGFWIDGESGPARYVLERNTWNPPNAHNVLLELLLHVGIIGAALWVGLFLRGLYRSVAIVRNHPNVLGLFPLVYMSMVLLGSITEVGSISRDLGWALLVVAILVSAPDRAERRVVRAGRGQGRPRTLPSRSSSAVPSSAVVPDGVTSDAEPAHVAVGPVAPRASFTARRSTDLGR